MMNKNTQRIFMAVLAAVMVLSMILPMLAGIVSP